MAERIAEQLLNVVKETRREVNRLRGKNVNLRQAFIIWYLQTTVTSTLSSSKLCLVNDPFAPADAIHIDNALKTITSISVNLPSQYTGSKAPKLGPHIRFEQTAGWLLNKSITKLAADKIN